jgi:predicted phage terminase large subunit-like protein
MLLPTEAITNNFLLSFLYLFNKTGGKRWILKDFHVELANTLQAVYEGKITRLIINLPPRYGKTDMVSIVWPAWAMGRNPDSEFILTSYAEKLAIRNTYNMRSIITHEKYRQLFPDLGLMYDSHAKGRFHTTAGGVVLAAGTGGAVTGFGAGKVRSGFGGAFIIDDPVNAADFKSRREMQNVIDWFQAVVEQRLNNPGGTPIIVVMQRISDNDLSGWLMDGGNGEKWHLLRFPAIKENGEALFPEKHSLQKLAETDRGNPYNFAAQFMQTPAPVGGGVIKEKDFQFYKDFSDLPKLDYIIITSDTAQKIKEHNDFSVFQAWGASASIKKAFLLDQVRGKYQASQLRKVAKAFYDKWHINDLAPLRGFYIEDKSSGTGLIQTLVSDDGVPARGVQKDKDKYSCLMDVTQFIETGLVYLPLGKPFTKDFIGECCSFRPDMGHAHDDQVDTMCIALNKIFNDNSAPQVSWV